MTKIVVEPLKTELEQVFETDYKMQINSINPWIYKDLSPAGNFAIEIWQNGVKLATSDIVTSADIEANTVATAINYYHGHYRFVFTGITFVNRGQFTLKLTQTGYTFSEAAYIGWVKPHENIKIDTDYVVNGDSENPFGVQIWRYEGKMTRIIDIDDGFSAATEPTIQSELPVVTGSFSSPQAVTAAGGVTITDATSEVIVIEGDGGAVNITADPQIAAPTNQGSTLVLIGSSDTNTVIIEDGTGLDINGPITLDESTAVTLQYVDGLWRQLSSNV